MMNYLACQRNFLILSESAHVKEFCRADTAKSVGILSETGSLNVWGHSREEEAWEGKGEEKKKKSQLH